MAQAFTRLQSQRGAGQRRWMSGHGLSVKVSALPAKTGWSRSTRSPRGDESLRQEQRRLRSVEKLLGGAARRASLLQRRNRDAERAGSSGGG